MGNNQPMREAIYGLLVFLGLQTVFFAVLLGMSALERERDDVILPGVEPVGVDGLEEPSEAA